jgi:hypothetical protein
MNPFQRSARQLLDTSKDVTAQVLVALRHGVQARLQRDLPEKIDDAAFDVFIRTLALAVGSRSTVPEGTIDALGVTVKGLDGAKRHVALLDHMLTTSGLLAGQPLGNDQARGCIISAFVVQCVSTALSATGVTLNWFDRFPPPGGDPPLASGSERSPYLLHSVQMVAVYKGMVEEAQRRGIPFKPGAGLPEDDERVARIPDEVLSREFGGMSAEIVRNIHGQRAVWAQSALNLIEAAGTLAKDVFVGKASEPERVIAALQAIFAQAPAFQRPATTMAQSFGDFGYSPVRQLLERLAELLRETDSSPT